MTEPQSLSAFLKENKAKFLADVAKDGAKDWTVIMGNEAGDLDSCASAIGYSYLTPNKPAIGLIQTPRADIYLRAENKLAFELAKLESSHEDLLTADDVKPSELKSSYALVDHNSLLPLWVRPDVKVVGIIDHHEDEKQHLDANPRRIIVPLGSCASAVVDTFKAAFSPEDRAAPTPPHELATLLLSAVYLDTGGLKPKGKAQPIDEAAGAFLETYIGQSSLNPGDDSGFRKTTAKHLSDKKVDVSKLSSRDLLRRDYKEFAFKSADGNPIAVGLSTVPLGLKSWLAKETSSDPGFRAALEQWAVERHLDVVGVLTTYHSANKHHKRRELALLIGGGVEASKGITGEIKANIDALTEALVTGLENDRDLDLESEKLKGEFADFKGSPGNHGHATEVPAEARLWRQNNTDATRKIIAPAFKTIIAGISGVKSTFAP